MNSIVLATTNRNKIAEFMTAFRHLQESRLNHPLTQHHLVDPKSLGLCLPEVAEDGDSPQANARLKAVSGAAAIQSWVLADDTILSVDFLNGRPGLLTARFAGPQATMDQNRQMLLEELSDCPWPQRNACFTCCLCLADPSGRVMSEASGTCHGFILPRQATIGSSPADVIPSAMDVRLGFGYDRLFWIPELRKTMAELSDAESFQYTHRARALRELK